MNFHNVLDILKGKPKTCESIGKSLIFTIHLWQEILSSSNIFTQRDIDSMAEAYDELRKASPSLPDRFEAIAKMDTAIEAVKRKRSLKVLQKIMSQRK